LIALAGCTALGILLALLVVLNGTVLARGDRPETHFTSHPNGADLKSGDQIRILSFNIAKAFSYAGRGKFKSLEAVSARLDKAAEVITEAKPDLVFLSEAMRDCRPCPINQIDYLAEKAGMFSWVYGENYSLGLPFYRISGGNAVMSRWQLMGLDNIDLHGRKPWYVSKNNRRAIFAFTVVAGQEVVMAALHNDSYHLDGNAKQARQIVDYLRNTETASICAGDFNAPPDSESLKIYRESGLFTGEWNGRNTFPAEAPDRTIDYILAPKGWELV
jgi:endonuclease/exonuclease/phosphatase family metal-dependent hydrolase